MDAPARRRPAPLIVLLFGAALGLLVGMVWSLGAQTGYSATTTVYVSTQGVRAVPDLQQQAGFDQQARDSYASVATAPIVLEPVARELGLDGGAQALARRVSVDRPDGTVVLAIGAKDASAARAATIANAIARQLSTAATTLTPSQEPPVHLTQLVPATAAAASRTSALVPVLLGLLVGIGAGAVVLAVTWISSGRPPRGGLVPSLS